MKKQKKKPERPRPDRHPDRGDHPAIEKGTVRYRADDGQTIKLSFQIVRKYLVSGKADLVTESELLMYMAQCKSRQLNPFKRDCYLIKFGENEPAAVVIAVDYLRARARKYPDCEGWTGGIIVEKGGEVIRREGALLLSGEKLIGGWFRAMPKGWNTTRTWEVPLERYIKRKRDGQLTQFWMPQNQPEQIAKVAESQGLRKVWPDPQGALYIREEILPGDDARDVTEEADALPMPERATPSPQPERPAAEAAPKSEKAEGKEREAKKKEPEQSADDGLSEEIRDDIAALMTVEDIRAASTMIERKLARVTNKNALRELLNLWNGHKQKISKAVSK